MQFETLIIPGFHPDPSICRVDGDFYIVNSSFEFFPGVPIHHSKDLVNWRHLGYCLSRESQLPLHKAGPSGGIWAPTIRYHNGAFYMVTTNMGGGGNFFVTTRDPAGPWSEPVWFDPEGWDPSLFFDDDGTCYLTRNGKNENGEFGIIQYTIDLATGTATSDRRMISQGAGGFGPEGPHMYKRDRWYYLTVAEGATHAGHFQSISRSRSPWGPFEQCPWNPVLTNRNHLLRRIQATAHADMIDDQSGNWWAVFLGIRNFGGCVHMHHLLGRETFLVPVEWKDGWPIFNRDGTVTERAEGPLPPAHAWPAEPPRDDFEGGELRDCWNFIRNPQEGHWSLTQRTGHLRLLGAPVDLDDRGEPAFIGRRQEHLYFDCSVQLDFNPSTEREVAGLTVFRAPRFHYDLLVTLRNGKRCCIVRRAVEDIRVETAQCELPAGPVQLHISGNPWACFFAVTDAHSKRTDLGKAQTKLLTTEISGGFVGVYLGMYATGNGSASTAPADFDWCDYTGSQTDPKRAAQEPK